MNGAAQGILESSASSSRVKRFVALNTIGGAAVLASYAWGTARLGDNVAAAWGGVPDWLQPWYVRSMFFAAAGYFPMTLYVLRSIRAESDGGAKTLPAAEAIYAAILVASALWMPLTCLVLEQPSTPLWLAIRIDLAVVGLASLSLLALLLRAKPRSTTLPWILAIAGALAFCVQTALLDAIVWPAYFSA